MAPARFWQQAEGAGVFLAGLALYIHGGAAFGLWPAVALFFLPDASFAAYAFGARVGAAAYNVMHLYAGGTVFAATGAFAQDATLTGLGFLWMAHCGFDRMLGYGLKLPTGFGQTHLGPIGRDRS